MIEVRPFHPEELEDFLSLLEIQIPEIAAHCVFDRLVASHYFQWVTAQDREGFRLYGAFQCGKLIGYGLATSANEFFCRSKSATLEIIYVHPEHRGGRCALRLMDYFKVYGKQVSAVSLYAGVNHGLEPEKIKSFFEHSGFEIAGFHARQIIGENYATSAAA